LAGRRLRHSPPLLSRWPSRVRTGGELNTMTFQSSSEPGKPDVPTLANLRTRRREIVGCARRHGMHQVRVFGSVATGQAVEGSDVDLLVRLEPGRSYTDIDDLESELTELLGYDVDVLTEGACHGRFASVLADAVPL
jgi:predicted nucleotidyltransferase